MTNVKKNRLRRARRRRHREERAIIKGEETRLVSAVSEMEETLRATGDAPDEQLVARRIENLLKLLRAYPGSKLLRGLAQCRESEWHFGRLHLIGEITKSQLDTAVQTVSALEQYQKSIYPGGDPVAFDYSKVGRGGIEDLSSSAQKSQARLQKRAERVLHVLHSTCEDQVRAAFFMAWQGDLRVRLPLLRQALDALAMTRRTR